MMIAFRAKREATRKFLLFLFQGLTYLSFLLNTRAIDAEESVFKKHFGYLNGLMRNSLNRNREKSEIKILRALKSYNLI